MAQQDPTIAKLAKQSLLFLTALLVFTMIMATMTFDYALTQASNLTPMAYIPLSIILFLAFTYLLVLYVKIAFARLGRFVSNTEEEISPNEIIGDLMMKGFL
jgi:ABC-type Na+ efflux pump permease subunit